MTRIRRELIGRSEGMGLFFNKKPKVIVNVTVREAPQPKQIRLTEQQRKLLKEGAVMDCDGNIFRPETVWIPNEPWN